MGASYAILYNLSQGHRWHLRRPSNPRCCKSLFQRTLFSIHASHNTWFKPKPREKSNTGRLALLTVRVDNVYRYKEGAPTIAAELILLHHNKNWYCDRGAGNHYTSYKGHRIYCSNLWITVPIFAVPQVPTTDLRLLSSPVILFPGRNCNLSSAF